MDVVPKGTCPVCENADNYHFNKESNGYQWCNQCGWHLTADGEEHIPAPCFGCGQVVAEDLGYFGSDEGLGGGGGGDCINCGMAHGEFGSRDSLVAFDSFSAREGTLAHLPDDWEQSVADEMLRKLDPMRFTHRAAVAGDRMVLGYFGSYGGTVYECRVVEKRHVELPDRRAPMRPEDRRAFALHRLRSSVYHLDVACRCDECELCDVRKRVRALTGTQS